MYLISQFKRSKWLLSCAAFVVMGLCGSVFAQGQSVEPRLSTIGGNVSILDSEGNSLTDRSNVVVFIDGLPAMQQDVPENGPHLMSHQDRVFSPKVLPILRGEALDFYNDDDIFHNVFSLSNTSKLVTFSTSGLVKIYCNIHPDMVSTILVLNNTLFTKTDAEGYFEIQNVPEGALTLRVWHEFSDDFQRTIRIGPSEQERFSIELIETKRRVVHKNKFGMPYRKKY